MSKRFKIYKKSKVYVVPSDNGYRDRHNQNMGREPVGNRDTYANAESDYDNEVDDSIERMRVPSYKIYPPYRPARRRRPYKRRFYPPEDDELEEIDRIPPRLQYWYHQRLVETTSTPAPIEFVRARASAGLEHQHLAAGVSFIALMLLILFFCCLIPLFCYLCRPKFRKGKGFNLKEWFKENLTPKEQPSDSDEPPDMPDFEKEYAYHEHEKTHYERPTIRYPQDLERQNQDRDKPRRTSLHIQLKETPLEMSISEIDEETEYISEMSDIGRGSQNQRHTHRRRHDSHKTDPKNKKHRSKSMPSTPAPISPLDRFKKRFSFGDSTTNAKPPQSPVQKKAPSSFPASVPTPATTATGTEDDHDEEVIYNRYSGKPIDDVTWSKSTQMIINTATAKTTTSGSKNPASVQRGDDDNGKASLRKTSSPHAQAQSQSQSKARVRSQRQSQSKVDHVLVPAPAPTPSTSSDDDNQANGRRNPKPTPNPNQSPSQNPPKESSKEFYENHMVN